MEATRATKLSTRDLIARKLFTYLIRKGATLDTALVGTSIRTDIRIPMYEAEQLEREAKIVNMWDYAPSDPLEDAMQSFEIMYEKEKYNESN